MPTFRENCLTISRRTQLNYVHNKSNESLNVGFHLFSFQPWNHLETIPYLNNQYISQMCGKFRKKNLSSSAMCWIGYVICMYLNDGYRLFSWLSVPKQEWYNFLNSKCWTKLFFGNKFSIVYLQIRAQNIKPFVKRNANIFRTLVTAYIYMINLYIYLFHTCIYLMQ